ncbi:MAG: HD family phosphohydrolase [Phycisphaerales bacterium]
MAKETTKSGKRTSRVNVSIKRIGIRERLAMLADDRSLGWGIVACVLFIVFIGSLAAWTREQPLIAVGQIMRDTRLARVEFITEDIQQTDMQREAARQGTARIYNADSPVFDELRASIVNLPQTLGGVETIDNVNQEIREKFGLSELELGVIKALATDEEGLRQWKSSTDQLMTMLRRRPMLNGQSWQQLSQEGLSTQVKLRETPADGIPSERLVSKAEAINIDNADMLTREISRLVQIAKFSPPVDQVVITRLTKSPRATFAFDASAYGAAQTTAAEAINPVRRVIAEGQKIFGRGDVLDADQYELFLVERSQFSESGERTRLIARRIAVFGVVGALTVLLAGYIANFCPRIANRPARIAWLALILGGAVLAACLLGVYDPRLMWLGTLTPIILVAVMLCIAYDQRTSLAITAILAVIAAFALRHHVGMFALMLIGIAASISQLREIRERRTLIRMSIAVAFALSGAAMLDQIVNLPAAGPSFEMRSSGVVSAGAQSFLSGLLIGGIALFILPFVEKAFDITTGMTLIELRDPKQPLLKELQQRAPGTYNHSLNVASIAESAAESIGADSLLTYVGCLYHDIGKMNKPGYFVENQSGGPNKHDKLNPAMSLLVIVGHVKDGMEIARAHNLPRNLRHFIEAHHGTTLVEYFYRRAKQNAEKPEKDGKDGHKPEPDSTTRTGETVAPSDADSVSLPSEVDYRYPGPRPRTKEVAITMLSDAVESATRTLADPTPSRIDALVRELANRRLMDGQFDNCDLTLRELSTICDSISKTVSSIYHGRVRYASTSEGEDDPKPTPKPDNTTHTGTDTRPERRA